MTKFKSIFLFAFIFVVFVLAFFKGFYDNSTPAYSLAVPAFICFVAVYAAEILGYQVGGAQLSLQKRVTSLEQENTELKTVAKALWKSIYALDKGDSFYGNDAAQNHSLVDQYLASIREFVDPGLQAEVAADRAALMQTKM